MTRSLQIKNVGTHNCMDTMGRKSGEEVGLSYCHGLGGNQVFAYTKRQQVMSDDNCMDATQPDHPVKLVRCHGMGGNQAWNYNFEVNISDEARLFGRFTPIRNRSKLAKP